MPAPNSEQNPARSGLERTTLGMFANCTPFLPTRPREMPFELLHRFGKNGWAGYPGASGSDAYGGCGQRKGIELRCYSVSAGHCRISIGESSSGTIIREGDCVAGKWIAILIRNQHGQSLGQLRPRRRRLIVAAADHNRRGDRGNGVFRVSLLVWSECDIYRRGGYENRRRCAWKPQGTILSHTRGIG